MTAIIRETYGLSANGLKRFATNRLLRIYPSYLIVFTIFAIVFYFFDRTELLRFDSNISTPNTFSDWLKNITLMGLDFSAKDRTIPPSWTLFVELFYYALIPVLLLVSHRMLLVWMAAAIAYHVYIVAGANPSDASIAWEARYGNVAAGALGFALGACSRVYLPAILKNRTAFTFSLTAFISCYAFSSYWALTGMDPDLQRILSILGYYGVMLSAAPVVDYLARMPKNKLSEIFGEFSYPFYLVHIPVGFVMFFIMNSEHKTFSSMLAGILASLVASWGLVVIDRKISSIRNQIRNKSDIKKTEQASA